ncbi:hypothetical protein C3495_01090 [Clostridiaceae bacterium 14S0207]|nr:hypothetical protein C3495_01090 [Clostridiaceae bacterium 14S0207]
MIISPYTAIVPAIYMTYKVLKGEVYINKNQWNIALFFLFIWALIVGAINGSVTSIIASFAIFIYFCVNCFMQEYCNNEVKIEKLFKYLLYFSIFSAVIGVMEKILCTYFKVNVVAQFLNFTSQVINNKRIYSTFGNPNIAGNWFAIMTLVSIYFWFQEPKKVLYKISTILFISVLCFTGSRGALMALLVGVLVFYVLKLNKNKKCNWIFVVLLLVITVITFLPIPILNKIIAHNVDRSFSSRVDIWKGCLNMFKDKPLTGWGVMAVWDHGADYIRGYNKFLFHAHNIWLTFMSTLGIVGIGIYGFMKLSLFKGLKNLYNKKCNLVPLLAGIQVLIIVHGLVDFTIIAPQTGLLFIICSSMIISLAKEYTTTTVKDFLKKQHKLRTLFKNI